MQSKQKSVQQAQQQAHDHGRAGLQVAHPHQDLGQPQQDAAVREHLRQELRKHRDQASGMKSAQEEQACITSQMRKQAMMDEETASQQQALLALQQQQLQQHPDVQFLQKRLEMAKRTLERQQAQLYEQEQRHREELQEQQLMMAKIKALEEQVMSTLDGQPKRPKFSEPSVIQQPMAGVPPGQLSREPSLSSMWLEGCQTQPLQAPLVAPMTPLQQPGYATPTSAMPSPEQAAPAQPKQQAWQRPQHSPQPAAPLPPQPQDLPPPANVLPPLPATPFQVGPIMSGLWREQPLQPGSVVRSDGPMSPTADSPATTAEPVEPAPEAVAVPIAAQPPAGASP